MTATSRAQEAAQDASFQPDSADLPGDWLGPQLSGLEIGAVFAIASAGYLMTAATPVLLGAMVEEGRLTLAQLGHAATSENLALTVTVIVASMFRRPRGLRWWGAVASIVLVCSNAVASRQSGLALVLLRGVAGFAEGIMVWLVAAMTARARNPGRWAALFSVVQGLSALCCVIIIPATVMRAYGAAGGYLGYAAIVAVTVPAVIFLPRSFAMLGDAAASAQRARLPNIVVLSVLLSFALFTMYLFGIWVYLAPLSTQAHHPPGTGALSNSIAVAAQLLGSVTAAFLIVRLRYFRVLIPGYAVLIGGVLVLLSMPVPWLFLIAAAVFGFMTLFIVPFQMMLAAEADPSRQAVVMSSGAMLLGSAAGPLLNSLVVRDDVRNCVIAAAACLLLSFILVLAVHASLRRRMPESRRLNDSTLIRKERNA